VDQPNEVDSIFVKAIPAGALALDALQITLAKKFAAVIYDIVLARNIKYILCFAALEHLIKRVELFRFRSLADIPRVDEESGRSRHSIDAIERDLEGLGHIFVCLLVKP